MATIQIGTTGHEGLDGMETPTSGTLAGSDIVAVLYDNTKQSAEIVAGLQLCINKLTQHLP